MDRQDRGARAPFGVLVVDDEPDVLDSLAALVGDVGVTNVERARSMGQAVAMLRAHDYDLVIADERLGDGRGTDLLRWVGLRSPATSLVLVSAHDDFEMLMDAVNRARIHQFFLKPWDPEEFEGRVRTLLEEQGVLEQRVRAFARALVLRDAPEPETAPDPAQWPPS